MHLTLIQDKNCPFLKAPKNNLYSVYHDGGHYIATPVNPQKTRFKKKDIISPHHKEFFMCAYQSALELGLTGTDLYEFLADKLIDFNPQISNMIEYINSGISMCERELQAKKKKTTLEQRMMFDNFYFEALKQGLRGNEIKEYAMSQIQRFCTDIDDYPLFVELNMKRVISNLYKRKKRFRRKAHLHTWNYFVTLTYNDSMHSEDTFKRKIRKCLSNLHTRRGWLYMGVFERAPVTNRLHFHGIFYIPDGEMIGNIVEVKDYDKHTQRMQTSYQNTFFNENYGRNDFKELQLMNTTINYLLKYIGKTNERIIYSRGIPSEVVLSLSKDDLAVEMKDFITKFVLFENVIDWERDIKKQKRKQLTIIDLLCNPPNNKTI